MGGGMGDVERQYATSTTRQSLSLALSYDSSFTIHHPPSTNPCLPFSYDSAPCVWTNVFTDYDPDYHWGKSEDVCLDSDSRFNWDDSR